MADRTTTLRLRRVRFKDGRTIDVLRTKPSNDGLLRANLRKFADWALRDDAAPMSGYAIMTWDKDHSSICEVQSDGTIPKVLVPDFVRNRLLGDIIERWAIDTINGE